MPDWTYHPLRPIAAALLGQRRSQRVALHALARLTALPGGSRLITCTLDHPAVPPQFAGRLGAAVPVEVAADAIRAMPTQGAGVVEVGPVGPEEVATVRRAAAGRRCQVIVRATTLDTAKQIAAALADPTRVVLARPAVLLSAGPSWFKRVIEARTPVSAPARLRDAGVNPLRWPAWFWGLLVGLGMVGGGLGAAAITLGPLLLWYDRDFLGMGPRDLHLLNERLVHFLQHDRLTMAGTMISIGVLYIGLSWGGIRQGWPWARNAYLLSGLIGFPTLFYFLGTGFVEPLHVAVAAALFPMFVLATWRRSGVARWLIEPEGPERIRRRALVGQLLMIAVGIGLFAGGAVVSFVGLTDVFVRTDLEFLGTHADSLSAANHRLPGFVAHDRAGFGGALMSAAAAITLLSAWGWRRGASWVWWSLALSALFGFGPALAVHSAIGYTSFEHLLPVYLGSAISAAALVLARPYLFAKSGDQ